MKTSVCREIHNSCLNNTEFQWLDIDMMIGQPWKESPERLVGSEEGPVPIIRMYGVARTGESVLLSVHGFTPYFYVSLPQSFELSSAFLTAMRVAADQRMKEKSRGEEKKIPTHVLGIEKVAAKQSLLGYHFQQTKDFIKVFVAVPSQIAAMKRIFDDGLHVPGFGSVSGQTYESNVPYILR